MATGGAGPAAGQPKKAGPSEPRTGAAHEGEATEKPWRDGMPQSMGALCMPGMLGADMPGMMLDAGMLHDMGMLGKLQGECMLQDAGMPPDAGMLQDICAPQGAGMLQDSGPPHGAGMLLGAGMVHPEGMLHPMGIDMP